MEKEINATTPAEASEKTIEPKIADWEQRLFPVKIYPDINDKKKSYNNFLSVSNQNSRAVFGRYGFNNGRGDNFFEGSASKRTDDIRLIETWSGRKFVHKRRHMDYARALAYGEMLYGNVAKQLGVPCIEYRPVTNRGHVDETITTVMSEFCYDDKTEQLVNAQDFHIHLRQEFLKLNSLETIFDILDNCNKQSYRMSGFPSGFCVDPNIKLDLFRMYVLDYITMQIDRRPENINFIINKETGYLRAAPIMDNGWIYTISVPDVIKAEITPTGAFYTSAHRENKHLSDEQICRALYQDIKLQLTKKDAIRFKEDRQWKSEDRYYDPPTNPVNEVKQNCENIFKLSKSIPGATQFLSTLSEKLNLTSAIEKASQEIGYDIPELEKQNVINTANLVTGFISQSLKHDKHQGAVESVALKPSLEKTKLSR